MPDSRSPMGSPRMNATGHPLQISSPQATMPGTRAVTDIEGETLGPYAASSVTPPVSK
jgi:hypothetical protein